MEITADREVELFDHAYKLGFRHAYIFGFRAGQLDKQRYDLAMLQYAWAIQGGINIALSRGNISLEEYTQIVESHEGD